MTQVHLQSIDGHTFDAERLPDRAAVLDVGCRGFGFTKYIRKLRPQALIYALDPGPDIKDPGGLCYFARLALVGDNRTTSKYADYSTGEGNFLKANSEPYYDARIIDVDCINITELMRFTRPHWDLVKLDCEGSEFQILEMWPGPIADQISVEFHDFDRREQYGDAYYESLFARLAGFGYRVVQHELSDISGRGAVGHWDTLLVR